VVLHRIGADVGHPHSPSMVWSAQSDRKHSFSFLHALALF